MSIEEKVKFLRGKMVKVFQTPYEYEGQAKILDLERTFYMEEDKSISVYAKVIFPGNDESPVYRWINSKNIV